jgi:hypothetical protein
MQVFLLAILSNVPKIFFYSRFWECLFDKPSRHILCAINQFFCCSIEKKEFQLFFQTSLLPWKNVDDTKIDFFSFPTYDFYTTNIFIFNLFKLTSEKITKLIKQDWNKLCEALQTKFLKCFALKNFNKIKKLKEHLNMLLSYTVK